MNPILAAILSALMQELEADPTLIPDLIHAGVGLLKTELQKVTVPSTTSTTSTTSTLGTSLPHPVPLSQVIGGSNVVA